MTVLWISVRRDVLSKCLNTLSVKYFSIYCEQSFGQIPNYKCTKGWKEFVCLLSHLNMTSSTKTFKVVPHQETPGIDAIFYEDSNMEILTDGICEALPYITWTLMDLPDSKCWRTRSWATSNQPKLMEFQPQSTTETPIMNKLWLIK